MATIIECTEGHYEAQEASYGEAYVWRSECDCGERLVLTASEGACRCRPHGPGPGGAGVGRGNAPLG